MINEEKIKISFQLLKEDILSIKQDIKLLSNNENKNRIIKEEDKNIGENTADNIKNNSMNEIIKKTEYFFENKRILITGGLGFIGSNLAHRLAKLNPKSIIILDSQIPGLGANLFNIKGLEKKVKVLKGKSWDLRNIENMKKILRNTDLIFNLAGSVSHIGSKENPLFDLEINLKSHLCLLEACKQVIKETGREIKIVYAGTRDQYGKVKEKDLPVRESQAIEEVTDPQGINKNAAEFYHFWYRHSGIKSCSLRLSNIYGERHIMKDSGQGVLNWFIRQALENKNLELWGGGEVLRDFIYADDVSDALLLAMSSEKSDGQAYNIGAYRKKQGLYESLGSNITTIKSAAELVIGIAGSGKIKIINYPEDRKSLEPGHFYSDSSKIYQDLGWEPKTSFQQGLKKTIDFYKLNLKKYI